MKRLIENKKGMTLIELIVTLGILSIVLTAAFSILLFGNKLFANGSTQFNIQNQLRFAMNFIKDETQYATDIEVLSSMDTLLISNPSSIDTYKNYIYYDAVNGQIVKLNKFASEINNIGTTTGTLSFQASSADPKTLSISLNSSLDGHIYSNKQ